MSFTVLFTVMDKHARTCSDLPSEHYGDNGEPEFDLV